MAESCVSGALWKQLSEHVDNFLDSVTVADLANKQRPEVVYGLRIKSNRILGERSKQAEEVSHPEAAEVA
jgi:DNA-binding IscR family transcriptional regulator